METINEKGKQEIREFLAANHKLGGDHFEYYALRKEIPRIEWLESSNA